jgi:hypothetical protein
MRIRQKEPDERSRVGHGIVSDLRGQDQAIDRSRALQVLTAHESVEPTPERNVGGTRTPRRRKQVRLNTTDPNRHSEPSCCALRPSMRGPHWASCPVPHRPAQRQYLQTHRRAVSAAWRPKPPSMVSLLCLICSRYRSPRLPPSLWALLQILQFASDHRRDGFGKPRHARCFRDDSLACRRYSAADGEPVAVGVSRRRGSGFHRARPVAPAPDCTKHCDGICDCCGRGALECIRNDGQRHGRGAGRAAARPELCPAASRLHAPDRPIGTLGLPATAQAIYGTVAFGAATSLLTLASGRLYGQFGAAGFWAMAALSMSAMPFIVKLRRTTGSESPLFAATDDKTYARVHDLKSEPAAGIAGEAAVSAASITLKRDRRLD